MRPLGLVQDEAELTMKIAMIQSFLPSRGQGGVGHSAHQLAEGLICRGHGVTLFSLDPPVSGASYRTRTLATGDGSNGRRWLDVLRFGVLVARQDLDGFDIIHAHGDSQWLSAGPPVLRTFYGSCLDEAIRARGLRTKALFAVLYLMELISALRADRCVGISRNSQERLVFRRMRIIPPGVDLTIFRPGIHKSRVPSVLFVGHQLHDRKRGDLLLKVFEETILKTVPDAVLNMVWDESVPARQWLRQHACVSIPALVDLYQQAWVFCLPSVYEGFGRPYIEAMACGTAVVATRNPGAIEILGENGQWGVISSDDDLGRRITALLTDPVERQRLERSGLERVRERFGLASVIEAYEDLYNSLLAQDGYKHRREAAIGATPAGKEKPDNG